MRYEHYLGRKTGNNWPHKVVAVSAQEVDASELGPGQTHTPQLASWRAVTMQRHNGAYDYTGSWEGHTILAWWDRLSGWVRGSRSALIISQRTNASWSLLGLWEQLESGGIAIYSPDSVGEDPLLWAAKRLRADKADKAAALSCGDIRREIESERGFLVLSDPPLIARFRLCSTTAWVTWLDMGNYGISQETTQGTVQPEADWCADAFRRLSLYTGEFRLGKHCATAGSQAYYGWRYGHYHLGASVHAHPGAVDRERASYYSGRAECYRLGPIDRDLYYLDIRSAYVNHCREAQVPVRLSETVGDGSPATTHGPARPEHCIATVTLRTEQPLYPYRLDNITIWPVGEFVTTLAGPELLLAWTMGHIVQWHSWSEYICAPALRGIATALYDWRCQAERRGDREMAQAAKAMYTSLVGQFAKREWLWERADDHDNDLLYGEWWGRNASGSVQRYRAIAGLVEREVDCGFAPDTLPAVACFVTSAARVQLAELMAIAGTDHVYYCDTDALMCDATGRGNLDKAGMVRANTLGYLGERWGPLPVELCGIKWYTAGGKLVCAGLPIGSGQGEDSELLYWRAETPKEAVRHRHRPDGRSRLVGYVRDSIYRHGVVGEDGRITPIRLPLQ